MGITFRPSFSSIQMPLFILFDCPLITEFFTNLNRGWWLSFQIYSHLALFFFLFTYGFMHVGNATPETDVLACCKMKIFSCIQ
jgi:hypothetical protein